MASTWREKSVSSRGHWFSPVDFDDPNFEHRAYDPWLAYGQSKTANILFAVEFDRRGQQENVGVEINDRSLTPGEGARIAATHFDDWLNTSAQK